MYKCEVCGKTPADKHHIVYKNQGGVDFPLNIKYLCSEHHRGINGPHKNRNIDKLYKLELNNNLNSLLTKQYYDIKELSKIIHINEGLLKIILRNCQNKNDTYKKDDIIFKLMGSKKY